MMAEALGIDTPERLSQLDWQGHPVLSVYLDLDPTRFPTPAARDTQLSALLSKARREAPDKDVDLIRALLDSEPALACGARGLAIFSSADADVLEAVRLPSPVEPMAVVDTVPWLVPLAGMISSGDWGFAVVSRSTARLFRGGPSALTEFATIHDELDRRHAQGGWSQARFQRGIEEQVAVHARRVADHLLRADRHRAFEHLVIVASDELRLVSTRTCHSAVSACPRPPSARHGLRDVCFAGRGCRERSSPHPLRIVAAAVMRCVDGPQRGAPAGSSIAGGVVVHGET